MGERTASLIVAPPGSNRRTFAENTAIMVTASVREHGMIAKLLLQTLIWIVAMGALLFVPADTLHWPAAWVFLSTMTILGIASGLWLAKTDSALLAQRMRPIMQ